MTISVVITHKDRPELLSRCINSIRRQNGGESVEIIVVDDFSSLGNRNLLRSILIDVLVENDKNMGAPYSRNLGIKIAKFNVIHLMDCDDYILNVNYNSVRTIVENTSSLYYFQIKSQGGCANYPVFIDFSGFIPAITKKYKHICQTSSLIFDKSHFNIRFDESLPKHQDWDFVYRFLKFNQIAKKIDGNVFFDRADGNSISRGRNFSKSLNWLEKIKSDPKYDFIRFYLLGPDKQHYNKIIFCRKVIFYLLKNELLFVDVLKLIYKRVFF